MNEHTPPHTCSRVFGEFPRTPSPRGGASLGVVIQKPRPHEYINSFGRGLSKPRPLVGGAHSAHRALLRAGRGAAGRGRTAGRSRSRCRRRRRRPGAAGAAAPGDAMTTSTLQVPTAGTGTGMGLRPRRHRAPFPQASARPSGQASPGPGAVPAGERPHPAPVLGPAEIAQPC